MWVNDFGPHTDSILGGGGDLYTRATYMRVYMVMLSVHAHAYIFIRKTYYSVLIHSENYSLCY